MGLIFVSSEKSCTCKESYGNKVNTFYFEIVRNSQMCFLKAYFKIFKEKFIVFPHPYYKGAKHADEH